MSEPFSWPCRVYYEDTDAGGVVYYANYLRFMERARTEFLRAAGIQHNELQAEYGVIFVVVTVEIAYRQPARLNDLLEVSVIVSDVKKASLAFDQEINCSGRLLCRAEVRVATVLADSLKPCAIPAPVREVLV